MENTFNPLGLNLSKQFEQLGYAEVLPNGVKRMAFLGGVKYQTGADYSEEQMKVEIIEKCGNCYGTGTVWFGDQDGDPMKDICDMCEGTAKQFVDKI